MTYFDRTWYRGLSWGLLLAYMSLIFWFSHQPTLPMPMRFEFQDKVVHAIAYAIMGFLAAHAVSRGSHKRRFWAAFVIACLYGVSDETHQYFVPGREASVADWIADVVGAWFGAYLYLKSEPSWRRNSANPVPR